MSTLTQVINADKAGFLEHLSEMITSHEQARDHAPRKRDRFYEMGVIDGLLIAQRAVAAWVEADQVRTDHYEKIDPDSCDHWALDNVSRARIVRNGRCTKCGEDLYRGYHSMSSMRQELFRRGRLLPKSASLHDLARAIDETEPV